MLFWFDTLLGAFYSVTAWLFTMLHDNDVAFEHLMVWSALIVNTICLEYTFPRTKPVACKEACSVLFAHYLLCRAKLDIMISIFSHFTLRCILYKSHLEIPKPKLKPEACLVGLRMKEKIFSWLNNELHFSFGTWLLTQREGQNKTQTEWGPRLKPAFN